MSNTNFEVVQLQATYPAPQTDAAYTVSDEYAITVFLNTYQEKSPHTIRSYQKECYRFLLWLYSRYPASHSILPRVRQEDVNAYVGFLRDSPELKPFSQEFLEAHGWKQQPFRKTLDHESLKHCISVLNKLFQVMQNMRGNGDKPYCLFNPFAETAKVGGSKKSADDIYRSFTMDEWHAILDTVEELPRQTERDIKHYHRVRWIMQLLYRAFLRRDEAANLLMGNFHAEPEGWFLSFVGKGDVASKIIATDKLMGELSVYRRSLGLSPVPSHGETTPAIMAVTGKAKGVTGQAIYLICTTIFRAAAEKFQSDSASRMRLNQATPHWMRHTGITHAMEAGTDPRYVQAQARHSSLNITAKYDHKERRAWRKAFEAME